MSLEKTDRKKYNSDDKYKLAKMLSQLIFAFFLFNKIYLKNNHHIS